MRDALPESLARRVRAVPLLRRLLETKEGHIVVGQFPNRSVVVAAVLSLLALFARGPLGMALSVAAALAWATWCALEIGWGVNLFRRALGALVLLCVALGTWLRLHLPLSRFT